MPTDTVTIASLTLLQTAYRAYQSLGRLPTNAPRFEVGAGGITVVRGELYCRMWDAGPPGLCGKTFGSTDALKKHLETFHGREWERTGASRLTDDQWEALIGTAHFVTVRELC